MIPLSFPSCQSAANPVSSIFKIHPQSDHFSSPTAATLALRHHLWMDYGGRSPSPLEGALQTAYSRRLVDQGSSGCASKSTPSPPTGCTLPIPECVGETEADAFLGDMGLLTELTKFLRLHGILYASTQPFLPFSLTRGQTCVSVRWLPETFCVSPTFSHKSTPLIKSGESFNPTLGSASQRTRINTTLSITSSLSPASTRTQRTERPVNALPPLPRASVAPSALTLAHKALRELPPPYHHLQASSVPLPPNSLLRYLGLLGAL